MLLQYLEFPEPGAREYALTAVTVTSLDLGQEFCSGWDCYRHEGDSRPGVTWPGDRRHGERLDRDSDLMGLHANDRAVCMCARSFSAR